jgi:OOP family OmpA-OmpF porin
MDTTKLHQIKNSLAIRAKTRAVVTLLVTAVGMIAAATVHAEPAGSFEAGLFGGYDIKNSTNELGNSKDKTQIVQPGAGLGLRLGYHAMDHLGLEVEAKYVISKLKGSGDGANVLGLRGHVMWNFLTEGMFRPFVRAGLGSEILMTSSSHVVDKNDGDTASFIGGAGTRVELTEDLGLRLDVVGMTVPGRNAKNVPEGEAWLGLYYLFGNAPRDADGDGVPDKSDKCPTQAEDKDGFEDDDGCPDLDNDSDGIPDASDKCPNQAETKNGMKDEDGCPDGDKDGDGIEDSDDKCPDQAENKNGFQDADGCPDDPDSDGDGIVDSKDKCPKQPETKNGFQDDDGCPDSEPDSDGDGIVDSKDKCPKEPETKNNYQDDDGCPDVVPEKLKKFSGAIEGIYFETGSAKILAKSFKVLDNAVEVLQEFKDTRVEIQGHTDNVGKPEDNQKLSEARAASVKEYFVTKGIPEARMQTVGFGMDKPVADNKTKAGQGKNRRIEFKLL